MPISFSTIGSFRFLNILVVDGPNLLPVFGSLFFCPLILKSIPEFPLSDGVQYLAYFYLFFVACLLLQMRLLVHYITRKIKKEPVSVSGDDFRMTGMLAPVLEDHCTHTELCQHDKRSADGGYNTGIGTCEKWGCLGLFPLGL